MAKGSDGPLKVVPYRNAESYVKGTVRSYPNGLPFKPPTHARTQNYHPETIKDHTGGKATKGTAEVRVDSIPKDSTGCKPSMIGLEGVVNDHQK